MKNKNFFRSNKRLLIPPQDVAFSPHLEEGWPEGPQQRYVTHSFPWLLGLSTALRGLASVP